MEEQILQTLMGQRFADWYTGDFEKFVSGDENPPSKEEILKQIKSLFHIEGPEV